MSISIGSSLLRIWCISNISKETKIGEMTIINNPAKGMTKVRELIKDHNIEMQNTLKSSKYLSWKRFQVFEKL